jgi:hypothetical protein
MPLSLGPAAAFNTHGGGSGLLLDGDLARAVRQESAAAVRQWWGVTEGVVWRWRKALGVTRSSNDGSRQLILAASREGAQATRHRRYTTAERAECRRRAIARNLQRFLPKHRDGWHWTREQLRLLGKEPDDVVAAKIGRTVNGVRLKRSRLGIPTALDRRHKQ